ncbi:hypothetical protein [Planosporangium mesophilum]|uniref:Uncharacterized protein n=1 Tax=Planosporangium mesophilum TaxID=689768 RepID=A0A8J3T8U1_9ACTN|nr:hypothetical protein [Planosporangium mesophilum]NJC83986.1 hypothetical protein [Planosporangium mesophilum]GII22645.1 hypothetical protein Pme01_22420 [Planosporangium mesophilum]
MSTPAGQPPVDDPRKPAGLSPATPVEKPLLPSLADLYLGNVSVPGRFDAHRTGGFVTRMQDITARTADEVAASHGVDLIDGWPRGGPLYVLRFLAAWPKLFVTSFGGQTPQGAARMGSPAVYPAPFLGTGYTPYRPAAVPEYFMFLADLPAGSEMYRIDSTGEQTLVGEYVHRRVGWVPSEGPTFGPARWFRPPVPAYSRVRRGLFVTHQGVEYEADFGPRPGQYTLHAVAGQPPSEGFAEQHGAWTKVVDDLRCDRAVYTRQLCTWRGAPFEVLDAGGDHVVVNFLGENYQTASALGLVEVDYRIWRVVVPASELTDTREEQTEIPPQGMYGR